MGNRSREGQRLHDQVLEAAAKQEEQANSPNYRVHRNPGQEKNKAVDGEYPDVVLELRGTDKVGRVKVRTSEGLERVRVDPLLATLREKYRESANSSDW